MSNSFVERYSETFRGIVALAGGFGSIPDQAWIIGNGSGNTATTTSSQAQFWNGANFPSSSYPLTVGLSDTGTGNGIKLTSSGMQPIGSSTNLDLTFSSKGTGVITFNNPVHIYDTTNAKLLFDNDPDGEVSIQYNDDFPGLSFYANICMMDDGGGSNSNKIMFYDNDDGLEGSIYGSDGDPGLVVDAGYVRFTNSIQAGGAIFVTSTSAGGVALVLNQSFTNTFGTPHSFNVNNVYNQTSTGGSTDVLINRFETAIGSGNHYFIDAQINGTSKFTIDRTGTITNGILPIARISATGTPSSSTFLRGDGTWSAGGAGVSGYSGISGYSGTSGFSGYSGISGFSGYSGKSGYSGISGYSGTPAGSNTYVQYNNSGAFGASSAFTFTVGTGTAQATILNATSSLKVGGLLVSDNGGNLYYPAIGNILADGTNLYDPFGNILTDGTEIFYIGGGSILADGGNVYDTGGNTVISNGFLWYPDTSVSTLASQDGLMLKWFNGSFATYPSSPVNGTMIFDTVALHAYVYIGGSWVQFDNSGGSGASGYSGVSGYSGKSGYSGVTGSNGTSGFSGTVGTSGFSGKSGYSGISGYSGVYSTTWIGLTDASTITTNASSGNDFKVTLNIAGATRILGNPSSPTDGQTIRWQIIQDSSGSRAITFDTKFVLGPFSAISLSTAANAIDFLAAIYDVTADKFYVTGFVPAAGFGGGGGTSGYSGASGYSGTAGSTGTSGYSGTAGSTGTSGFSGTAGSAGASGFSGKSGYSGTAGSTGSTGASGFSGASGISGYSGASGISGYSGYSGVSGYSGKSGYSGIGTSGFSGYSGSGGGGGSSSGLNGYVQLSDGSGGFTSTSNVYYSASDLTLVADVGLITAYTDGKACYSRPLSTAYSAHKVMAWNGRIYPEIRMDIFTESTSSFDPITVPPDRLYGGFFVTTGAFNKLNCAFTDGTGAHILITQHVQNVGGPIFDYYTDQSSSTSDTTLYTDNLPINAMVNNGDKITAEYGMATTGTSTKEIKFEFGGVTIFDSGGLSANGTGTAILKATVIRVSSTTVRYGVTLTFCVSGLTTQVYQSVGSTTVSDLTTNTTAMALVASSSTASHITAKYGTISYIPSR